jgi:hypothetical protein
MANKAHQMDYLLLVYLLFVLYEDDGFLFLVICSREFFPFYFANFHVVFWYSLLIPLSCQWVVRSKLLCNLLYEGIRDEAKLQRD